MAFRLAHQSCKQKIIDSKQPHVAVRDDNGNTAFHWAAQLGLSDIMTLLLSAAEAQARREAAIAQAAMQAGAADAATVPVLPPPPSLYSLQVAHWNGLFFAKHESITCRRYSPKCLMRTLGV